MVDKSSAGKRILVVEDEPAIGRICTRTLEADGFQVEIAANGRIARDILQRKRHDLYLIDIRTPEMNGVELYKYLEKGYPELTKKVVFTTGDVMSGDIGSFLKGTGRPFLPKPFTPDQLRAAVRAVLPEPPGQVTSVKMDNGS